MEVFIDPSGQRVLSGRYMRAQLEEAGLSDGA